MLRDTRSSAPRVSRADPAPARLVAQGVLRRPSANRYRLRGSLRALPDHLTARVIGAKTAPAGAVLTFDLSKPRLLIATQRYSAGRSTLARVSRRSESEATGA
jgi:hypothetical protein